MQTTNNVTHQLRLQIFILTDSPQCEKVCSNSLSQDLNLFYTIETVS